MVKLGKEHRAGIVSGLLASIVFIYFLQPILEWTSKVVVKVMTLASSAFLDRIYAQAASLQTQDYGFLWLLVVFGAIAVASFLIGIHLLTGISPTQWFAESVSNGSQAAPAASYRIALGLFYLFVGLLFIVVASANFIQLKAISSFQQHMRALEPFISELEEEQLYSRWSLMKTNKDYQDLYIDIRSLAQRNRLELPESKLYEATTL